MRRIFRMFFLVVLGLVVGIVGYEGIMFVRVLLLRNGNPTSTSLIDTRIKEAEAKGQQPRREQVWVSLDKISPNLQRAVLAGEDTNFLTHRGFDYEAIQKAFEQAQREAARQAKAEGEDDDWLPNLPEFKRGGSTISQQLAKNLANLLFSGAGPDRRDCRVRGHHVRACAVAAQGQSVFHFADRHTRQRSSSEGPATKTRTGLGIAR